MSKNDWLIDKLRNLDDEAFVEVIGEVAEKSVNTEVKHNDELVHITELEDVIKKEYDSWGKVKGLRTGFPTLDEKLGGMEAGHVILIGGETSNGKSALATNIAVNVAKQQPVLFITLEMLAKEIGSRIMHINNGKVDDLDMMFQSEHRLTYKDLKPLLERAKEMGEIKLVVLDYLQYLGRGMKPEEVAVMSKEIKTLALEFEIPFIVIVSLRKEGSGQGRKWTDIEIQDFMGTGSIGYDADAAMIASRKDKANEFDEHGLWVKILKVRNGKLDYNDRYIRFDWEQTRISESWVTSAEKSLEQTDGFKEV